MDPKWYIVANNVLDSKTCQELANMISTQELYVIQTNWYKQHRPSDLSHVLVPVIQRLVPKLSEHLQAAIGPSGLRGAEPRTGTAWSVGTDLQLILGTVSPRVFLEGCYMGWHIDYIHEHALEPVYECVLTLSNTSDSTTMFKRGPRIESIHSKPGSVVVLQRRGVCHQVTPVTLGERVTVKFSLRQKILNQEPTV
jgi:hypothetical protein